MSISDLQGRNWAPGVLPMDASFSEVRFSWYDRPDSMILRSESERSRLCMSLSDLCGRNLAQGVAYTDAARSTEVCDLIIVGRGIDRMRRGFDRIRLISQRNQAPGP